LPDDPRVRALSVRPHDLADYEKLARETPHEHPDDPHPAPAQPDECATG
jgi:hypothetical protein